MLGGIYLRTLAFQRLAEPDPTRPLWSGAGNPPLRWDQQLLAQKRAGRRSLPPGTSIPHHPRTGALLPVRMGRGPPTQSFD